MKTGMAHGSSAVAAGLLLGLCALAAGPAWAEPGEGKMKPVPSAAEPGAEAPSGERSRDKRPPPPITWADGPEVSDAEGMRRWFDGLAAGERVRLPVTLERSPLGGVSDSVITGVAIRANAGARAAQPEPVALDLHDGRLGISLAERVRMLCGDDGAKPCSVWIEGDWRAQDLLLPAKATKGIPLAVTAVGSRVMSHPNAPPRVARQAKPGDPPAPAAPKAAPKAD